MLGIGFAEIFRNGKLARGNVSVSVDFETFSSEILVIIVIMFIYSGVVVI